MLIKTKKLKNYNLESLDGEIGKVKDFYFDDRTGVIKYLIVNTGNWLTGRQVLVAPNFIVSVNKEEEYIKINLTKDQIENSPILENDKPASNLFQSQYRAYFGSSIAVSGYDGFGGVGATVPYIPLRNHDEEFKIKNEKENEDDSNLRSTYSVSGYNIQALDDTVGHVDDLIIDDVNWRIQYLEIDTKNWLPGKKVILSSKWIHDVNWSESTVAINLSSEEIKQSPEYTEEALLDRDYEIKLHKHYKQTGYWVE